jgi:putative heme-binding domain-containing protein
VGGEALRAEALTLLSLWPEPPKLDRTDGRFREIAARPVEAVREILQPHVDSLLAPASPALRALGIELLVKLRLKVPSEKATILVADAKVPASVRLEALRLLAAQDAASPQLADILEKWLAAAPGRESPLLRSEALRLIAARNPARALDAARAFIANGELPEQQAAWPVLGAMQSPEADALIAGAIGNAMPPATQLEILEAAALRASKAPVIAAALERFEKSRAGLTDALAQFSECLEGGDPRAGREIALTNVSANCAACHRFEGAAGSEVGPALDGVASRGDRRHLLESLVAPGAKVTPGYGLISITKKNGETLAATLLGEKAGSLRLRLPDGKEISLATSDIASQTPPVSIMPPMGVILNKRQIREVVAYLGTLKAKR